MAPVVGFCTTSGSSVVYHSSVPPVVKCSSGRVVATTGHIVAHAALNACANADVADADVMGVTQRVFFVKFLHLFFRMQTAKIPSHVQGSMNMLCAYGINPVVGM
jgi:hypothetical protein